MPRNRAHHLMFTNTITSSKTNNMTLTSFTYKILLLFICLTLTSCRTLHTSEKAVSERETASVTESRLSFYRTIDSLSRQLSLSADSISITFTEFPTAFTSELKGCTETPSDSLKAPRTPHKVKVYGLHLNENIEKKSIANADLKDSVNKFTQSKNIKSSTKQKSAPATSPHHYVFFIYIVVIVCIIMYLKKRFQ